MKPGTKVAAVLVTSCLLAGLFIGAIVLSMRPSRVRPTRKKETAGPAVKVSAEVLAATYRENEVLALEQYEGKSLEVTGVVAKVGREGHSRYVLLYADVVTNHFGVECRFDSSEDEQLSGLRAMVDATIRGRCVGKRGRLALLERCRVVP